jgi:hypothetical protein
MARVHRLDDDPPARLGPATPALRLGATAAGRVVSARRVVLRSEVGGCTGGWCGRRVLVGASTGPPGPSTRARWMEMVPWARSMSAHRRARSSPRRAPVVAARTRNRWNAGLVAAWARSALTCAGWVDASRWVRWTSAASWPPPGRHRAHRPRRLAAPPDPGPAVGGPAPPGPHLGHPGQDHRVRAWPARRDGRVVLVLTRG